MVTKISLVVNEYYLGPLQQIHNVVHRNKILSVLRTEQCFSRMNKSSVGLDHGHLRLFVVFFRLQFVEFFESNVGFIIVRDKYHSLLNVLKRQIFKVQKDKLSKRHQI